MISNKLFIILILCSVIILISEVEAIPVHCQCAKSETGTVSDCTTGSNCAVEIEQGVYSTGSCIIIKQDCNCNPIAFCNGGKPCCYSGGKAVLDRLVDSCDDNYAICQKDYKCPNTGNYNGNVCELIDDCCYGSLCENTLCVRKTGKWDASQRRCVVCDDKKQGKVIVDSTTRYMDVKNYGDCGNKIWTDLTPGPMNHDCQGYKNKNDESGCKNDPCCEHYITGQWPWTNWGCKQRNCLDFNESFAVSKCGCSPGASRDKDTCESACGADPVCDEKSPNSDIVKACRIGDGRPYSGYTCNQAGKTYFQDTCNSTCGVADKNYICRSAGSLCTDGTKPIDGCTAISACNGIATGTNINTCTNGGQTYFADKCSLTCEGQDRDKICRSSAFAYGCTADSQCNGVTAGTSVTAGTGYCSSSCQYVPAQIPTTTIRKTGGGCGRWCYRLGLTSDSEFYLITAIGVIIVLIAVLVVFQFLAKKK
jgi:hypothetical protein